MENDLWATARFDCDVPTRPRCRVVPLRPPLCAAASRQISHWQNEDAPEYRISGGWAVAGPYLLIRPSISTSVRSSFRHCCLTFWFAGATSVSNCVGYGS